MDKVYLVWMHTYQMDACDPFQEYVEAVCSTPQKAREAMRLLPEGLLSCYGKGPEVIPDDLQTGVKVWINGDEESYCHCYLFYEERQVDK